ncbi:choice-of-anchor J domain-containing protein [Soonwooa sp.]|uniref:choice-of-anchor J domain-containing protein n=1 Tax=Soonwooa sp. TaxID=1938592 RepID=UPI0035AFC2E6
MKKILLSSLLVLGLGANAQWIQNFDNSATLPSGWTVINGGDANGFVIGAVPAGGNVTAAQSGSNVARITYGSTAHDDYLVTPAITVQAGVNDRISYYVASFSSAFTEDYSVMLSNTTATAAAFTTTLKATSKATSAWTKVTLDLTPYVGQTIYVGFRATDTNQWYLMFDTIVNDTAPTTVPNCVTATTPADGATGYSVRPTFTWPDAAGASGYKVYLGTSSGSYDILNGVTATSGASLGNNPPLNANTPYYLKIVPLNDVGSATGCTETMFTTGANPYAPYCGPFFSNSPTAIAPIKSVALSTVNNASDASATNIGSFAVNEDFTSVIIPVENTVTALPITVRGMTNGGTTNGWAMSVFIDWNNDGDFGDAGESYFNTTSTMIRSTTPDANGIVTLTGNIAIPSGTSLGTKRMRVKYNFSGITINSPLTTACADMSNGQVEDYTINYKSPTMAVNDINKLNVSVYPNPFKDVLKISDVKDATSVIVSDISGRTVAELKPATELNLSHLNKGVYIVNIKYSNGEVKATKVIKE